MNMSNAIDMLVYIGIIAIVVVAVVAVLQYMGIAVPRIVYIIAGAIVGILLLLWIAGLLKGAIPG